VSVNLTDKLKQNSNTELSILVVDDDVLNQRLMQLILSREGYNVSIASNGMEAIELARTNNFDVILMDLQMPIMDGMSASRQIREWEKHGKHTFIVALTASFLPEKGQELFEAGIDNYISKPFDLKHLQQILRYSENSGKATPKMALSNDLPASGISFETGLHKLGGNEEMYKELLGEFIEELPRKLERLDACYQNNEFELLSRLAHNLKGVSANLGGMQLSEQAGKLEKQIDSGNSGEIKHIIDTVRVAAEEFQKSASKYLSN
jgi:CheY-like chemotaxis protein/HPt (histidine-containing phosphotransfer) domain-containing protein